MDGARPTSIRHLALPVNPAADADVPKGREIACGGDLANAAGGVCTVGHLDEVDAVVTGWEFCWLWAGDFRYLFAFFPCCGGGEASKHGSKVKERSCMVIVRLENMAMVKCDYASLIYNTC